MTFNEALAHVLDLLQRQGWVSFRTLRRRFQVDEATLAQLQQILLVTYPVSVDDTGARLVWQGELRPTAAPTRAWDVMLSAPSAAGATPWPLGGERSRRVSPLVGREYEVGLLRARWAQVQAGQGQVVALSGEAGIGKSRLVQVVSAHVADNPHRRWACHGASTCQYSAFAPILDLLQQVFDYQPEDKPAVKLQKLETTLASFPLPEAVPLLAALLTVPLDDCYPPLTFTPERQRQQTLETMWHRCWSGDFLRRSRRSRNCWPTTTPKPGSRSRPCPTGCRPGNRPCSARPTRKPCSTSRGAWRSWPCSLRLWRGSSRNSTCRWPWGRR